MQETMSIDDVPRTTESIDRRVLASHRDISFEVQGTIRCGGLGQLTLELREEHLPQGEAQSDAEVGLDDGKIDQADAPGNKYQAGVMKKVVGNQQEKESTKRADYATQKTGQSEMLGTHPETMNAENNEKRAGNYHDKRVALFTQEPMLAVCHRLFN